MREFPSSVLFACSMNAIRSPIAESLLKFFHGHRINVDSVGVRSDQVDGFAIAVMDEIGIDISGHKPKTFEELEDNSYDLVVSLSPEAQHQAIQLTHKMAVEVEFWNTFDPSIIISDFREIRLDSYRKVRDELMERISKRFPVTKAFDT